MNWIQLNPLSTSGFLLTNADGPNRDILIDLGCPDMNLTRALASHNSDISQIAHAFITHMDCDHITAELALLLAKHNARIYIGHDEFHRHKNTWPDESPQWNALLKTDSLTLLKPTGSINLKQLTITWATFPHGPSINNAYVIDNHLFSGDTPIRDLLNPDNPHTQLLLNINQPAIHTLVINTTHLARQDIYSRTDLPQKRIDNYLYNHGIAEDLFAAMDNPKLNAFFASLKTIVPYHIRHEPLAETAARIRCKLIQHRNRHNFTFDIIYPGHDPATHTT